MTYVVPAFVRCIPNEPEILVDFSGGSSLPGLTQVRSLPQVRRRQPKSACQQPHIVVCITYRWRRDGDCSGCARPLIGKPIQARKAKTFVDQIIADIRSSSVVAGKRGSDEQRLEVWVDCSWNCRTPLWDGRLP